jgi:hypothetical protein
MSKHEYCLNRESPGRRIHLVPADPHVGPSSTTGWPSDNHPARRTLEFQRHRISVRSTNSHRRSAIIIRRAGLIGSRPTITNYPRKEKREALHVETSHVSCFPVCKREGLTRKGSLQCSAVPSVSPTVGSRSTFKR